MVRKGVASAQVLTKPTSAGDKHVTPVVALATGAGEHNCGVSHLLVLINRPRFHQPLVALLLDTLLGRHIQEFDLDGQFAPQIVQQRAGDPLAYLGGGRGEGRVAVRPIALAGAQFIQRFILDSQQPALLQVGGGHPPAPAQVVVDPVGQHLPQGALGLFLGSESNTRVHGVTLKG